MAEENKKLEDLIKAGLGATLLAKDRLVEEIERILKRKDIGEEDREDIKQRFLERAEEETNRLKQSFKELIEKNLEHSGFAKKQQLEELNKRISKLEEKIDRLEN